MRGFLPTREEILLQEAAFVRQHFCVSSRRDQSSRAQAAVPTGPTDKSTVSARGPTEKGSPREATCCPAVPNAPAGRPHTWALPCTCGIPREMPAPSHCRGCRRGRGSLQGHRGMASGPVQRVERQTHPSVQRYRPKGGCAPPCPNAKGSKERVKPEPANPQI